MKNSYIIIGVVAIVLILAYVFGKGKTEAPVVNNTGNNTEVTSSFVLADGKYSIKADASTMKWKGEFVTGLSEEGTVGIKSGQFEIANGAPTSGTFVVDMTTIKDVASKTTLENHLKSDDFFAVAKYPESTFILKKIIPSSEEGAKVGRYVVAGDLTIKGITVPVSFPATITTLSDGTIRAESSFAINRADWQVKYGSQTFFSNLGDKVIRDAVEIALDLKAIKE